jgi:hypothetical protein
LGSADKSGDEYRGGTRPEFAVSFCLSSEGTMKTISNAKPIEESEEVATAVGLDE